MKPLKKYQFEIFKKFNNQDAHPLANKWLTILRQIPLIDQAELTGELRRGEPSVEKIEMAASSPNPMFAISTLCELLDGRNLAYVPLDNRVIFHLESGIEITIWIAETRQFGNMLHFTTGSQSHLDWFSEQVFRHGFQYQNGNLNQNGHSLEFKNEVDLYGCVSLPLIPPELREGLFENEFISSPRRHKLITREDIQADLHVHSDWSDGVDSLERMVQAAVSNGLSLIAFTDHSPYLLHSRYTDHSYLFDQYKEIDQLNIKYDSQLKILKGVETDILEDGSLDLANDILENMDIVIASMHTKFDLPKEKITARYIRAIEHPMVNIIGHPGGRLYPMSDYTDMDWEKIFQAAAFHQVALEINSHKSHPYFDGQQVNLAAKNGVPITLNSDSHHTGMFENSIYGIFIARRAGLSKSQVINTWPIEDIQDWLRKK